jgi:GNAT superfamily N-acetyltransferase
VISIRQGTIDDFDAILMLMDEAVAWLAGQGRTGQWGSEPFSTLTRSVEFMRGEIEENDLRIAEIDGEPVGAMLLGEAPTRYVEPVAERELYLHLLVTSRRFTGQGIGRALVGQAKAVARERGIDLIRVDCYGGDDRKLVAAYERLGFRPTHVVMVKEWPAQVLAMRLSNMSKMDIEC